MDRVVPQQLFLSLTRDTELPDGDDRIPLRSLVLTQYRSLTDRQRDGRIDGFAGTLYTVQRLQSYALTRCKNPSPDLFGPLCTLAPSDCRLLFLRVCHCKLGYRLVGVVAINLITRACERSGIGAETERAEN